MSISTQTNLCMIIGDPIEHSLSPTMHNAGYRALKIADSYVFISCRISADALEKCLDAIKTLQIRGVSCTTPHKTKLLRLVDELDPVATAIGAVNTIVNQNGRLKGFNTDWLGVVRPLEQHGSLAGKKVALIGSGGAARAAAYGLQQKSAEATIYNRTLDKAAALAQEFGIKAYPLESLSLVRNSDIIISAVSYDSDHGAYPIPELLDFIQPGQIVFDITYGKQSNTLLDKAQQRGAKTLDGLEMLLQQGIGQFELFTGLDAPESAMRTALSQRSAS